MALRDHPPHPYNHLQTKNILIPNKSSRHPRKTGASTSLHTGRDPENEPCATASAGRNTRWTRMYSIGTGSREFWMHLWRMFSKKEFEGKGWLMRQKEELIWDRRGAEREHGTRSTARLLIFPFNHPASLARGRRLPPPHALTFYAATQHDHLARLCSQAAVITPGQGNNPTEAAQTD